VPPKDLAITYVILGVVHMHYGDFKKSEIFIELGLKIRTSLGDKKGMAACYIDLALVYQRTMNIKACEELHLKALRLYEEIGYQTGILISLLNLGALYSMYDINKAEEYYLKALDIAKLTGAKRDLAHLYHNLGTVNMRRLMDDQAFSNFKRALAFARETNFDEGHISISIDLSEYYRRRKQLKKGKMHLLRAQTLARRLRSKYDLFDCTTEEIEYLILSGSLKKAEQLARKLATQFRAETNVLYRVYYHVYLGKVAVAQKKYRQALDYYDEALEFIKALPSNIASGEIFYLKGTVFKKEKKFQEALNMFLAANKTFQEIGHLRYLDQIEHEIADVDISEK
jgi:tetratricopeptide (TPR) repeat protein